MAWACSQCGYLKASEDAVCSLCGPLPAPGADAAVPLRGGGYPTPPHLAPEETVGGLPIGWVYLAVGLALSLVFTVAPLFRFMGWFIGALFHETGHVIFAWFVGCPAFPAISLRGHAAAFHQDQNGLIALAILGMLLFGAWQAWQAKRFFGLALGALVVWPFFTFLEAPREVGFLLSGHLAELAFAGIFLWRARTGGQVRLESERPVYACLGWYLVANNAVLAFGLAFVPSARAWYMTSGSFGLTNDYARVANQWLHLPLEAVGIFMFLVAVSVFPLVLALTWTPRDR
ncbi:MAG: hypothetical protein ACYTG6_02900 [Planctomycetota bacterium]|jgi:hypothetical protein